MHDAVASVSSSTAGAAVFLRLSDSDSEETVERTDVSLAPVSRASALLFDGATGMTIADKQFHHDRGESRLVCSCLASGLTQRWIEQGGRRIESEGAVVLAVRTLVADLMFFSVKIRTFFALSSFARSWRVWDGCNCYCYR